MKTNKILININNLKEINEYKKIGITNFLFAVKNFSIGYTSFELKELKKIEANIYLLINRIMDTKAIDEFKKMIPNLNFVKGIFFEDIGIYNILKNTNIPLIYNQTQFATNTESINYWLKRVSSAVLSNSITEQEIIDIINNVNKPVIFNVFAKNMVMYSRRTLLTNFNKYMNLNNVNNVYIQETLKGKIFEVKEDNNGTTIFNDTYFNYINIIDKINDNNIMFYYINNLDLNIEEIKLLLSGSYKEFDSGFLEKKTVFKVGDLRD